MLNQIDKDIIAFTVGNDYGDSFIGHFAGNIGFSQHTSTSETGFGSLNIGGQIFALAYLPYHLRGRIGRRTIIDTIDIAEYD